MATLTEVIREAVTDFAAKKIGHVVHGGPPPPDFNDHIAAAVAAHMLSEAVVERVIQAGYDWQCADWPDDWHLEEPGITPEVYTAKHMWPVMVAAALGEHEEVGRG